MTRLAAMIVGLACAACATAPPQQIRTLNTAENPRYGDPSFFFYTRIFCTPDRDTHFENAFSNLTQSPAAPPAPPIYLVKGGLPATSVNFTAYDPGWGADDLAKGIYHPPPTALFAVVVDGSMSIKTSDGETRRFNAGSVLRVEDVAPCKGHITVNDGGKVLRIMTAR
jgi:hypothetical protein